MGPPVDRVPGRRASSSPRARRMSSGMRHDAGPSSYLPVWKARTPDAARFPLCHSTAPLGMRQGWRLARISELDSFRTETPRASGPGEGATKRGAVWSTLASAGIHWPVDRSADLDRLDRDLVDDGDHRQERL